MYTSQTRRSEREDRCADIAAELRVHAGRGDEMRDQRRRRRLAIGAGDADEWSIRREMPTFAAEQFDIADHLDAGFACKLHGPMRQWMGERNAGREHERGKLRPIDDMQISRGNAG